MKKEALRRIWLKASFDVSQNKKVARFYNVLLKEKEPTGFEPVRRLNTGSADFESAALPLCHVSITMIYYSVDSGLFQVILTKSPLPTELSQKSARVRSSLTYL